MINKKGSSWWTWFLIILFIVIGTKAVLHFMINESTIVDINDINKTIIIDDSQNGLQNQDLKDYNQQQMKDELQQQEKTQQPTSPSCQSGYTKEYKCSGDWSQRKHLYSDCNFVWELYEACQYSCGSDGKCDLEPQEEIITVSYVSDGDTLKLSTGETIRLIGLNASESGQSCSSDATAKLKELVLEKEVTLEKDIDDKDQYGRLLRYVYVGDTFVNFEMVRLGLAHKYEYGSNTKYSSVFELAEYEAKQKEGCLWKPEKINYIQDKCIYITNFHFDATGNDNYNLNDEYVTFGNKCSYSIDMTDWAIKDETASHLYTIPSFTFQSGTTFTLYTGIGTNTNSTLYWGRISEDYAAIWNNGGDTLFLRDSNGNLVLTKSYS